MDICANVQYNKVLEADPLELLEAGYRTLKAGRRTLKAGHGVLGSRRRGREMKANLKFVSFSVRYSRRL